MTKTKIFKVYSPTFSRKKTIFHEISPESFYVFLCGLQISLKISSHQYKREEVVWVHAQDVQVWYKSGRRLLFSLDRSF